MASVNKVILVGNLGQDPEVRRTQSGTSVASFSVATTERYTDKSGARQEKTEWHNVVLWSKLADLAGQYLKKGRSVYIEGKLQTSTWEDKNGGGKRYKTEIVGTQMQFLGGRDGAQGGQQGGGFNEPAQNSYPQDNFSAPQQQQPPMQNQAPGPVGGMDDELPF